MLCFVFMVVATMCMSSECYWYRMLCWVVSGGTGRLCGAEHYWRDRQLCCHSIVSQGFTELEGSSPHSQELSTCPYSEPHQSSPHHPIMSLQDPS
jgi:hypothetical protein